MKAITIWASIILTAVTCFGLGWAIGGRTEFDATSIAKFFGDWQSLISAITAIFTTGATLQAGWWALSGAREQIATAAKDKELQDEKRYEALRARILFDLNHVIEFCMISIYYINNGNINDNSPKIDRLVIDDFTALIEAKNNEISECAAKLVGDIQVTHSWVTSIHAEKANLGNAIPIATLECIILHEKCMKWFDFSRNESDHIDQTISRDDIKRFIHLMRLRENNIFKDADFDIESLDREIDFRFPREDSEGSPPESSIPI